MLSFQFPISTVEGRRRKVERQDDHFMEISNSKFHSGRQKFKGQGGHFREFSIPEVRNGRRQGGMQKGEKSSLMHNELFVYRVGLLMAEQLLQ